MIYGIGTDIVAVARMTELWQRHGERALDKILAPEEVAACRRSAYPERFLAKRFAAKEAFGKALGTGIRTPVHLAAVAVVHDAYGKPGFAYAGALATYMTERRLTAQLSLSDEQDYAVAFVIVEQS